MKPSSVLSALAVAITTTSAVILTSSASALTLTPDAHDAFARTVVPGLGNANLGGSWLTATPTAFRVGVGWATISPPHSGATSVARLTGVSQADELARLTFSFPTLPTSAIGQILTVRSRVQPDGHAVAGQIRVNPAGGMRISVMG